MKKLLPISVVASLAIFAGACALPAEARVKRAVLAERLAIQSEVLADEIERSELERARAEADRLAEAAFIAYQKDMALVTTPEEGAALALLYMQKLREIENNVADALANRLLLAEKARVSARGHRAINEMAEIEARSISQWEQIVLQQALPAIRQTVSAWSEFETRRQEEARIRAERRAIEAAREEERRLMEEEAAFERERAEREETNRRLSELEEENARLRSQTNE